MDTCILSLLHLVCYCFFFSSYPSIVPWRLVSEHALSHPSFCAMFHHINFVSNTFLANHPLSCLCSCVCSIPTARVFLSPINRLLLSTCHPNHHCCISSQLFPLHLFHVHCRPLAAFPHSHFSPPPVLLALIFLLCMKGVVCTTMCMLSR